MNTSRTTVRQCAAILERWELEYAVTGLAAAWAYSRFATFRLSTLFLRRWPDREILSELGFRETESGTNVWLVVAKDPGVFDGREKREGIWFVSPLQAYLDLKESEYLFRLRALVGRWCSSRGRTSGGLALVDDSRPESVFC
ncbi:MAG: hypothetical protein PVJ76_14610 [Gemmatimonadota bacterium]